MALLYAVAANHTVGKGGAGRELAADACKEFSLCNKVSHAGYTVIISPRTSHFQDLFFYCICRCVPVWGHESSPVTPVYLNHYYLVWAWQCANVRPLSNFTLSLRLPVKWMWVRRVLAAREWIGRFHFAVCPSKSEVTARQTVLHRKKLVMEVHVEKLQISFYPWPYTLFTFWKSPISPWKLHLGRWVQGFLSTYFIVGPSSKYCMWLFCQGHRSATVVMLSLWVML